jgi:hypothetical protein
VRALAPLPVLLAALALAPAAWAPPPTEGTLVPGVSLGGVELGMTRAEVRAAWGDRFGVCRNCRRPTWYFTLVPFEPQGAGVAFRRRQVVHVFTVWSPPGWQATDGLALGADEVDVGAGLVLVDDRACRGYTAKRASTGSTETVFYIHEEKLWGFGLVRPGANPCL